MQGLFKELKAKVRLHGWAHVLLNCYAICFGTTMLVALGFLVAAGMTASSQLAWMGLAIFVSAFAGLIVPLYPVGIASFALVGVMLIATIYAPAPATTQAPSAATASPAK